jgi:hypothetical protein
VSLETRKQDAEQVLQRWERSSQSPAARERLIGDSGQLWSLAQDLAEALENLLAHVRTHQHGYIAVARRRWPAAEWIIGDGRYASVAHCDSTTVILFTTPAEAEHAKTLIDHTGCGHACHGEHEITDLDAARGRPGRVARETPSGSGNWVITGEPNPRHPREAPQFECSFCRQVIAKNKDMYLLDNRQVACWPCMTLHDLDTDYWGSRAVIATKLGIWSMYPPRRTTFSLSQCQAD